MTSDKIRVFLIDLTLKPKSIVLILSCLSQTETYISIHCKVLTKVGSLKKLFVVLTMYLINILRLIIYKGIDILHFYLILLKFTGLVKIVRHK